MINDAALASEINNDPTSLGLVALRDAGNDQGIADALNLIRSTIDIERSTLFAYEVFEAIVPSEWAALTAAEKQRVQTILSMGTVNVMGTNTRASLAAAFGAGTTTRTNLLALQTRDGSRCEQLFGAGVFVTAQDVARALGRP